MNKKNKGIKSNKTITYILIAIGALLMFFPFYWMTNTALKSIDEAILPKPTFYPKDVVWGNFKTVLETSEFPFLRLMFNTVYVGAVSTFFTLITTILAAFAFARLEFKGKKILLSALLATMMVPGEMFVLSNYLTVSSLGWLDTYTGLIVPFVASVFYIYLLTNNFKQIPEELYLTAKIDGTSDFKYLFKVMVPIAKPTLISIGILKMIGSWNSYIWPNLITSSLNMRLITNGLRAAFIDNAIEVPLVNIQMAASLLVTLPVLIAFIFLKQYIMKGAGGAGTKG